MKSRAGIPMLISLAVGVGVFFLQYLGFFGRMEDAVVDLRFRQRGTQPGSEDVVLVTIDEKSLKELGLYAWPRRRHGQMVDLLTKAGAKAIAFDILFPEPDIERAGSDQQFAAANRRSGKVVLGMMADVDPDDGRDGTLLPTDALADAGTELGLVNIFPEQDSVVRKIPLWAEMDGRFFPSLSVAAVAVAQRVKPEEVARRLADWTDGPWNEALVNFTGWDRETWRSPFKYYSYASVLKGRIPPETFKGKIVIVCGTAVGLFDYQPVPNLRNFPGPEIHANAISNILNGNFLQEASPALTVLLVLLLVLVNAALLAFAPAWVGAIAVALWTVGYYLLGQSLFENKHLVVAYVTPTFAFAAAYGLTLLNAFLKEEREKRWIKGTFSQYLSPKLVDILVEEPERLKLGGEEREISIFFSDIAGFTTLSESMSPTALVGVLNEYLSAMSDIILSEGGYLDKYIGDAIMAFWNAPVGQAQGSLQACRAALKQAEMLKEVQRRFAQRKLPLVDCRMGLNTGQAIVGNMGTGSKFNYTAIGDTVNLASRLEAANKEYGTRIMITEVMRAAVASELATRELDSLRVKGKNIPMKVYELLGKLTEIPSQTREAMGLFEDGLGAYRGKRFKQAIERFTSVLKILPEDGPAKLYIARSEEFIKTPPPGDWDGVYVMTHK